ncbi:MAG TPA: redoxin domain-containing protein [Dokdonella sp.]
MKPFAFVFAAACAVAAALSSAAPVIGQPAPDFTLTDSTGTPQTLSAYKGRVVVLEWTNPECPFVRKHYGAGNLQKQQADAAAAGVVWLTVNSSAPGKQGHLDADAANAWVSAAGGHAQAYLLDADGTVGHAYDAKTTPDMYVVDAQGVLRYMGGIDSIASADKDDLAHATQYVPQALAEIAAGKPVSVPVSEPYGCSVKYAR